MKYALLIYGGGGKRTEEDIAHCTEKGVRVINDLKESGQFVAAAQLQSTSVATTVRMGEGKPQITDGPFIESHEQLGGLFIIDAPNLDVALEAARSMQGMGVGAVEVRPVNQLWGQS